MSGSIGPAYRSATSVLDARRDCGQHGACPDQDASSSTPPSPTGRSTPSWWPSPTCTVARWASGSRRTSSGPSPAEHGMEACDYLLAVDVDMNPLARLPLHQLGHRLRRLRGPARLRHGPADPLAAGHGLRHLRPDRRARGTRSRCRPGGFCGASWSGRPSAACGSAAPPSSSSSSSRSPSRRPTPRGGRTSRRTPRPLRTTSCCRRPARSTSCGASATRWAPPASRSRTPRARRGAGNTR